MTIKFSELDSVRYINFYYEDASTNREKALGWILLELSQKGEELKTVFLDVFSSIPILQLYRTDDSYIWQNRKDVLDACDSIRNKDLYSPCPLMDNFIDYLSKRK